MKVKELIEQLNNVEDKELEVVLLSENMDFKTVTELFEDKLGYDFKQVRPCIRIK